VYHNTGRSGSLMLNVIIDSAAICAPIYTLLALIVIGLFIHGERLDSLNKDKNPTSYVYKKKQGADANDPDAWKKKFMGSWTLIKREGIKEVCNLSRVFYFA
jgi:hypothetical protein